MVCEKDCYKRLISDPLPSNSSLLEFYNEVMTFNDSVVELVCCKLDGSPVSVFCGQGLSCAAACYSEEAVLCPSHNCEDCENIVGVGEGSEERKPEGVKERGGGRLIAASFSSAFTHCTRRGCPVTGSFKYCCFHPLCRNKNKNKCSWLQYFLGELNRIFVVTIQLQAPLVHVLVRLFTENGFASNSKSRSQTHLTSMAIRKLIQVTNILSTSTMNNDCYITVGL